MSACSRLLNSIRGEFTDTKPECISKHGMVHKVLFVHPIGPKRNVLECACTSRINGRRCPAAVLLPESAIVKIGDTHYYVKLLMAGLGRSS